MSSALSPFILSCKTSYTEEQNHVSGGTNNESKGVEL